MMTASQAQAAPVRRAAVIFVFVTVMLDMLALGIVIPVLPKLVESFLGGDTSRAAEYFGVFATAWARLSLPPISDSGSTMC
jgi:DHA1 family tetracycline resistance protein-like MFS transporter